MSRVIIATNLSDGKETKYASIAKAVADGHTKQCIYDVLKGKQAYHKGKLWRYAYQGFRKDKQIGEKRYVENVDGNSGGDA